MKIGADIWPSHETTTSMTTWMDNYTEDWTNTMDMSTTLASLHDNSTQSMHAAGSGAATKSAFGLFIEVVYVIGIVGNAAAIVALRSGERRMRNRKHLLLLTSLAANDLFALVGMLCAKLVVDHVPGAGESRLYCGARVLLRTFGIGSVCIAVTMGLERYMALTKPFLYQKQVTYKKIRLTLVVSWAFAALLTCAPVLGVGLYFDEQWASRPAGDTRVTACLRYRQATTTLDVGYAATYMAFGTLLCIVLVYCNVAVICALAQIRAPAEHGAAPLVRRVSKTSCRRQRRGTAGGAGGAGPHHNAATAEEVAFSRLMAALSALFMICWLPQMGTSALYLALNSESWARLNVLSDISNLLMLLNYVLDPILYVLVRRRRGPFATLCHSVTRCFKRSHKMSDESVSMKTSCCAPETVLISDSSEGRPLRVLPSSAPPHAHVCASYTQNLSHVKTDDRNFCKASRM